MGDSTRYKILAGGMQVEAKRIGVSGAGSLGCIAETLDTGKRVLLSNAHVIADFAIGSDITVGHPSMSPCCNTFSHPVGKVIRTTDPKTDLLCDAAIAEISGIESVAQVLGIGAVRGVRRLDENQAAQQIPVQMRGAETGRVTRGKIFAWNKPKVRINYPSKGGHFFYRHGTDQLLILGDEGSIPFAQNGDSGSVVLDMEHNVVALLHGASGPLAYAAPIQFVEDRMKIKILTTTTEVPIEPALTLSQSLGRDARTAQLLDSPAGRVAAAVFERHYAEVRSLVRENLRVAAIWRRNGGPEILQALVDAANEPERPLPSEVRGLPFGDRIQAVFGILSEQGSSSLRADVEKYGRFLAAAGGYTLTHLTQRFAGEFGNG